MLEAGLITRDVEQFVCINLKVDAEAAGNIEAALDQILSSGVTAMFPEEGQTSLIQLREALETSLITYNDDYNEYGEYEGKQNEES